MLISNTKIGFNLANFRESILNGSNPDYSLINRRQIYLSVEVGQQKFNSNPTNGKPDLTRITDRAKSNPTYNYVYILFIFSYYDIRS